MAIEGIQSVDRSLEILRIVAERGIITATELAGILGIHQSSASRHLKSLYDAGYIRKPDFHSFAPDYGVLLFAGTAMKAFPLVEKSAEICSGISAMHGIGAAIAVLVRNKLVYLSWVYPGDKRPFHIVDDSDYPVYKSSMGIALSYTEDKERFRKNILNASVMSKLEAEGLYKHVDSQIRGNGFLYLEDFHGNRFNAAMVFEGQDESRKAAVSIFSKEKMLYPEKAGKILTDSVLKIRSRT